MLDACSGEKSKPLVRLHSRRKQPVNPIRANATKIIAAGFLCLTPLMGAAQQNGAAQSLQQMLVAQYPPATPTPDGSDLVAAGAVLVLQKDNLLMRTAINNLIQMNGHGVA